MSQIIRVAGQKVRVGVGSYATLPWKFTQEELTTFGNFIKDTNPIHYDREAARKRGVDDKIVFGMMTGSIISNLLGNLFPGAVYAKQDFQFRAPVYLNEDLLVKIVVESLTPSQRGNYKCALDTTVLKVQKETLALSGKALMILDPREVEIAS